MLLVGCALLGDLRQHVKIDIYVLEILVTNYFLVGPTILGIGKWLEKGTTLEGLGRYIHLYTYFWCAWVWLIYVSQLLKLFRNCWSYQLTHPVFSIAGWSAHQEPLHPRDRSMGWRSVLDVPSACPEHRWCPPSYKWQIILLHIKINVDISPINI